MFLEKLKLKKYKEIIFVDTENVGYHIPTSLPKNVYIYLFVSSKAILNKQIIKDHQHNRQVKIIDISNLVKKQSTSKNAMDFCLITKLTEIIQSLFSYQKVIILSKDKGYDAAISFLQSEHPHLQIERHPFSMLSYFHIHQDAVMILKKLDSKIYAKISQHSNMIDLKKSLTKKQRKLFIISSYIDPISNTSVWIEYDIYNQKYSLYLSGAYQNQFSTIAQAKDAYQATVYHIKQHFQKYYSAILYKKAKDLKIQIYIEEASLKNMPLQKCLIEHLGNSEGEKLFHEFINSSSSLDNQVYL